MSEHTKEPWHHGTDERQIEGINGNIVCIVSGALLNESTIEDARRIVACVNACAGISTEWLEKNAAMLQSMAEDIQNVSCQLDEAKAQRDELLAEVEEWRAIKAAYLVEYAAMPSHSRPGQYHGHAHDIDGIWDSHNRMFAGCKCAACMMHRAAIISAEPKEASHEL